MLVAALFTATAIVAFLTGFSHVNAATIFLFAFVYALTAGILLGMPLMGELIRERRLTWALSSLIGAAAALAPGLIFVVFLASCAHTPKLLGMAMCVDGTRTLAAWGLSAALLGSMTVVGAFAGLIGFVVYKASERTLFARYYEPQIPRTAPAAPQGS